MVMVSPSTASSNVGKPITITVPGTGGSKTVTIKGKTSLGSASHILQQANAQVSCLAFKILYMDGIPIFALIIAPI